MPNSIILRDLIKGLNLSVSAFERKIGVGSTAIGKAIDRGTDIKDDTIDKISKTFPHVNRRWLETGEGEIFLKIIGSTDDYVKAPGAKGGKKGEGLIPYYEVDFMAGNGVEFYEADIKPAYFMDIPEFRGCVAFRAYSDSMEELIKSGNILFGTKIDDWQSHLEYGQIYGITMQDNRRYLKFIRKAVENKPSESFLLRSQNDNYDDFEIPRSKIKNIWLIEGWLNRRT